MNRFFTLLALAFVSLVGMTSTGSAQSPFASNDGIEAAEAAAKDSLGNDVVLVGLLGLGQNPITGGESFNIETGEADMWIYMYYSPTQDKGQAIPVLQLVPGIYVAAGGGPLDSGLSAEMAIATSEPFSNSPQAASAIRNNADYQIFREDNGAVLTIGATLMKATVPIPGAPDDFPANDEVWSVYFMDDVDTTKSLICWVATSTGASYCMTSDVLSVREESALGASLEMSVAPNPAAGRSRVTINAPTTGRSLEGVRIGLFDASGREVLDLTESFAASGYRHAEFDASTIPSGSYFCRAVGGGFNGVIGTIVLGR
jgi:hypothetical protein